MTRGAAPRLLPVVILALLALGAVKGASLAFSFASAGAAETSAPAPADAAPIAAPTSEAEKRLLDRLAARRAELDALEAALDTRLQLLEGAELRIETRFTQIAAEKAAMEALAAAQNRRQTDEFAALSAAYERMKPRDAARLFDALDEDILVPVAAGMRTQALSGVLAEMNADKARRLTRLLAERDAAAPAGAQ